MALRKPKENQHPKAVLLGKVLEIIRKHRGLTQGEVYDRCGVSVASISAYERGDRYPKTNYLRRICNALEISYGLLSSLLDPPQRIEGPIYTVDEETGEQVVLNPAKDHAVPKVDPVKCAEELIAHTEKAGSQSLFEDTVIIQINTEKDLIDNFRQLPEKGQKKLMKYISKLITR